MNIVACVSEGIYANGPLPLDGASRVGSAAPLPVPNPGDERAVEAAGRLTEQHGGRVTAVTVGPMSRATRRAYTGLGANASLQVLDETLEDLEPLQVAWVLAAILRPLAPDLVLCGERATGNHGSGLVPFALAEFLGLPVVPGAVTIRLRGASLEVERIVERGDREVLHTSWPAVVTIGHGWSRTRYPALAKANRAPHDCLRLADLGLSRAALADLATGGKEVRREVARPRPKKFYVPPATMSAADRLAALMAGGRGPARKTDRTARFVEGPAAALAATILEYLGQERILEG